MSEWYPTIIATMVAVAVALAGGLLTDIGPWYEALRKPSWNPPNWAFGPAWTVIFTLTAIAGVKAWEAAVTPGQQNLVLWLFGVNAVLNAAWSLFFFKLKRPDWALVENAALWLSILVPIIALAPFSPWSSWLLMPYIVWVSFAMFLNYTIYKLNRPFGAAQVSG